MQILDAAIIQVSPYVPVYRQMYAIEQEEHQRAQRLQQPVQTIRMLIGHGGCTDRRRYNDPTANEVAAVFVGTEGRAPDNRDIAVYPHDQRLPRISTLNANCDPLTYPPYLPF